MARYQAGHFLLGDPMKGTKFTADQFNDLLAALNRLEPDQDEAETLAVVLRLLAAGFEINLPHHDEAASSSPVTVPSTPIFQD
jgi:hypothetical protein